MTKGAIRRTGWGAGMAAAAAVLALAVQAAAQERPPIDDDDIGGLVQGPEGPEAGVWVIAETRELATRYIKAVVTDDDGRYVLPDLPEANYRVWARGYGLVDSPQMHGTPGKRLDLIAVPAPNAAAAAQYYPAISWYAMLEIPGPDMFGGASDIPTDVTQEEWLSILKNRACIGCHQLGQEATRTLPAAFADLASSEDAWQRRVQSGQSAPFMVGPLAGRLGGVPFRYFAGWTDRIAAGELPRAAPPRPQGVERGLVVTIREWGSDHTYLHDAISTDKRYPTVNAYGPVYGSPEYSTDLLPVVDPVANEDWTIEPPPGEPGMPESLGPGHAAAAEPVAPSAYWGDEKIWSNRFNSHNPMFDREGRLWLTAAVRGPDTPVFCRKGSDHPSAKVFPIERSLRQLSLYEPDTGAFTHIDTCFGTHHLQFGFDENETLWTSGGGPVLGWLDSRKFLETGDAAASQGWTPLVLDTNGNGRRDDYVEPDEPVDPAKDKRIPGGFYAVMPSPVDGSVWGTVNVFGGTGAVVRVAPGNDPSNTALAEIYHVPLPGFGPRGADIDGEGVVWVSLGSGHLGSFDRRKCKGPLNGPEATGDHCPEGWSFHQYPGPGFAGIGENSAESSYYTWVDQHDTLGLGRNVPISTGNLNDGLIAFKDGEMVVLRVPYPLGFYAKGLDGRIDDPEAGWKGRGLWASSGDRTPWLKEGGKGTRPLLVHFQLRPDPLDH